MRPPSGAATCSRATTSSDDELTGSIAVGTTLACGCHTRCYAATQPGSSREYSPKEKAGARQNSDLEAANRPTILVRFQTVTFLLRLSPHQAAILTTTTTQQA